MLSIKKWVKPKREQKKGIMKKDTRTRVLRLEQDLNDIVEGKFDLYNMTEIDAVVEIAKELISLLKGK